MWDKNFCLALFLNLYNQLFWLESLAGKPVPNPSLTSDQQDLEILENGSKNESSFQQKLPAQASTFDKQNLESLVVSQDEALAVDQEALDEQIITWQTKQLEITSSLAQLTTSWERTLITTKAILITAYLELEYLQAQGLLKPKKLSTTVESVDKNSESLESDSVTVENTDLEKDLAVQAPSLKTDKPLINQVVSKYLKLAQDYVDNKNVSLIHAVLTKIYLEFKE